MTIGSHFPHDGSMPFAAFVLLVLLAVLGATYLSLNGGNDRGVPMSSMTLLYPAG